MQLDQILDTDMNREFRDYLSDHEEIEWEGSPHPKIMMTFLDAGGYFDVMTGPSSLLGFILAGMVIGGYICYTQSNWIGFSLTMLVGSGLILFPDIIKYIRKKNTKYAVTNHRVFFRLWWWGKTNIYFIDFADVVKIVYQEYEDKSGIIHFMTNIDPGFYTYDFQTGRRRDYPSFEMIPDVIEMTNKLEKWRLERIKSKGHEFS